MLFISQVQLFLSDLEAALHEDEQKIHSPEIVCSTEMMSVECRQEMHSDWVNSGFNLLIILLPFACEVFSLSLTIYLFKT